MSSSQVVHAPYSLGAHSSDEVFHLCALSDALPFEAILGRTWLTRHNPRIDWRTGYMTLADRSTMGTGRWTRVAPVRPPTNINPLLVTALQAGLTGIRGIPDISGGGGNRSTSKLAQTLTQSAAGRRLRPTIPS